MTDNVASAPPPLRVEELTVRLGDADVLRRVTFDARRGQLIGVVGPNGAGKTTLFNAIVGTLSVPRGSILISGNPPEQARGSLAYIPQRERVNWRFPLTAFDAVMLGRARKVGWLRRPGPEDRERVRESLERVGVWDRRSALLGELSGGQRQRVFVARALAQEAELLLLDEAFSGIDVASQETLVAILHELRDDGKTILMVTHDLTGLARRMDAVLCLNGHVCAYGPPETAFTPEVLEELYGPHGVALGSFPRGGHGHAP